MIYFEQDKIFVVKIGENGDHYDKTELEAFLAVLQYGSISAAAERLYHTAGYESQNEIDGRGTGIQPF